MVGSQRTAESVAMYSATRTGARPPRIRRLPWLRPLSELLEMYVVPKGMEHRPVAAEECCIMLVEPRRVVNTGEAGGSCTAENDVWV